MTADNPQAIRFTLDLNVTDPRALWLAAILDRIGHLSAMGADWTTWAERRDLIQMFGPRTDPDTVRCVHWLCDQPIAGCEIMESGAE